MSGWTTFPIARCGLPASDGDPLDVLLLHEALEALEARSPLQARIIELRFFSGLQVADVADVLDVSKTKVEREQRVALAWLNSRIDD